MKIAYVIDTIEVSTAGTQKQLLETIRRLDRTRFEPIMICLWESSWMRTHVLPCPHRVLNFSGFIKKDLSRVVRDFARLIEQENIDVVHTFFEDSIFVSWLGALASRRRPALISSRRDIGLGSANKPWYHRLYSLALPVVNLWFDGIVANSANVKAFVARRELTPARKIVVHYNGVTLPEAASETDAPSPLPDTTAGVWIGIVASLTPVKRHDILIDAFARLRRTDANLNARLLIVGEGPLRDQLHQQAIRLGVDSQVFFVGAVTDVGQYLRRLDVGVLCSDREGLSNAILEYMAYGLPVVATAVGGSGELVSEENGALVPAANAEKLASALSSVVRRPDRRSMGDRSRRRIAEQFSWERCIANIQDYYTMIIERRSKHR